MSKTFKANVNSEFDFEFTDKDIANLDNLSLSNSKYHVLDDFKSYAIEISSADFNEKIFKVKVNNNVYKVNIFNDLDVLIQDMGFEIGSSKIVSDIKAPMPGLILEINIKPGQQVKENDALLILEAMKMENVLTSPRDGIIKSIAVEKGDAVDKNQLLIEFQ